MTCALTKLEQVLVVIRRHFGRGGPSRILHTLVPLVFAALRLASTTRRIELGIGAGTSISTDTEEVIDSFTDLFVAITQ
jgi:hypothetical protein